MPLKHKYPASASAGEVDAAWSNELKIAVSTARLSGSALQAQSVRGLARL